MLSIIAMVLGLVSLLLLGLSSRYGRTGWVMVVGLAGVVCGIIAAVRREKAGRAGLVVATVLALTSIVIASTLH